MKIMMNIFITNVFLYYKQNKMFNYTNKYEDRKIDINII